MKIPERKKDEVIKYNIQSHIDNLYERNSLPYRSSNIGASSIGNPCLRALYLSFRWAGGMEEKKGRILRIFEMGSREEDIMVKCLKDIGVEMIHTGQDQLKIQLAPHIVVRPDGVIMSGLPDIEDLEGVTYPLNFETKTMNRHNFDKLEKQGVRKAKPEYFAQSQCEMEGVSRELGLECRYTFFTAICKDDCRIYAEIIPYEEAKFNWYMEHANQAIYADKLPEPYSIDPESEYCKYCDHSIFCHVSNESREVNCRTCAWARPDVDGTWKCSVYDNDSIPYEAQTKGCPCHSFNPSLVPYVVMPEATQEGRYIAFVGPDGKPVYNGYGCVPSKDLWLAMVKKTDTEVIDDWGDPLNVIPY